jgi:hypothetical protein
VDEDDDDPYPWNQVLWVLWLALAMFGIGGVIAFVWTVLTH